METYTVSLTVTNVDDLEVSLCCFIRCKGSKVVSESHINLLNPMKIQSKCLLVKT